MAIPPAGAVLKANEKAVCTTGSILPDVRLRLGMVEPVPSGETRDGGQLSNRLLNLEEGFVELHDLSD